MAAQTMLSYAGWKAVEFAQKVKHDLPSRREAGIAADSVILCANILKRLEQDF